MNDIEKAQRAVRYVLHQLMDDKELKAIKMMEMTYQCSKTEGADFVYTVKTAYDIGN